MANPTAREQELLELINRMRIAPSAELALILASSDQAIKDALTYFKVDLATLKAQWQKLTPAAPLAWSSQLSDAAATHDRVMIQYDQQSHHVGLYDANGNLVTAYEPDLAGRISATGYQFTRGRENIYGYANSIVYADAGFAIDWGEGANSIGGIQNPAGHRETMMAPDVREVGISVMDETDPNTKVGPLVVTEDFGNRADLNNKAWLLGVAFQDKNQDGWYEAGEGLNDVQVKITGINGTNFSNTITVAAAGGYQDLLDPGQYQVDFLRGGKVVKTQTTSIAAKDSANVKLDLVLPVISIGVDPLGTTPSPTPDLTISNPVVNPVINPVVNPVVNPAKTIESFLGTNLQTSDPNGKIFNFTVDNTQRDAAIDKTKSIAINFTGVSADAAYHNYGGLYRIEDANGTVMDTDGQTYKPGDTKYLQAALRRSKITADGTQLDRGTLNGDTTLKGAYMYAPFVVANGKVDDVLNATDPTKAASVYFNYVAANADGFEHFKLLGANKLGCEDTFGGGDKDYNDLIFQLNAKVV
jgi:uncharacterized protein YkwD